MMLRNLALVTLQDAGSLADDADLRFLAKDGTFSVKGVQDRGYAATVWWAAPDGLRFVTQSKPEPVAKILHHVNEQMFGAFTWCSPHAFSALGRLLHWERLSYPHLRSAYDDLLRPGLLDIVDVFYTPDNQRSTLTREDRDSANIHRMVAALPALATTLETPKDQAAFLLRMCYAAAGMTPTF